MAYLSYVSDDDLRRHTKKVLDISEAAVTDAEIKLYRNVVDPFSAVFDSLRQSISLVDWLKQEKSRQIQKTMQNAIGDFHADILGSVDGWKKLPTGHVLDLKNDDRKIVAELKNKWNTTKGNHMRDIYQDIESQLDGAYRGCTGYYVEIVPHHTTPYDKPFTPSDNVHHRRMPENDKIRVIDGKSFYALVTGEQDALTNLYKVLPKVISEILGKTEPSGEEINLLETLFEKAYGSQ